MSPDHTTFYWHDYETFGRDARVDRPAQFAGVRTDAELREIGEPLVAYCQPTPDFFPDPQSCVLTGITPQHCQRHGWPERVFAERIHAELSQPGTIGVGYNSIRFDDEFTRHLLWRNLLDPYGREWRDGCSRWDLLDVMRAAWALRPEGIEWPRGDDGQVSLRLEHLSAANGLTHTQAHDALSDVRATIALARLLRARQPRLFEFALGLRRRERVMQELGLPRLAAQARPFVHVSGMLGAARGFWAVMWPLAQHPRNRNEIIAWDLAHDPRELADLRADEVRARLFVRAQDLPAGVTRLPIKSVHLNRAPFVLGQLQVVRGPVAERWGVDWGVIERNAQRIVQLPDLSGLWAEVYATPTARPEPDVDAALYDGFVGDADRRRLARLRALDPREPAWREMGFDDARLGELVFRFRARNHPDTLDADERARWQANCCARLLDGAGGATPWQTRRQQLLQAHAEARARGDAAALGVVQALWDYAAALGLPVG